MLGNRIITAIVLIPLVIGILFLLSPMAFSIVALLVSIISGWEWARLSGFETQIQRISLGIACGILLGFMLYIHPPTSYLRNNSMLHVYLWASLAWWVLAFMLMLSYPGSARIWRNSKLLRLLFGLLTIVPFFWGMLVIRTYDYQQEPNLGAWLLLYVMVMIWAADTGAYFTGRLFGKHKLAPRISPGKTWEGLIGGLILSGVIALAFSRLSYMDAIFLHIKPIFILISSIVTVLVSILGDLTESMFKREVGIKDSSQLIPGHGGVLDRIDSLTAAIPIFACLLFFVFGV